MYVDPVSRELFKSVDLYYNAFDKDYGILPGELDIHKVLNWKGGVRDESDKKFYRKA